VVRGGVGVHHRCDGAANLSKVDVDVGPDVLFLQVDLVHVRVRVFGSFGVGVRVFVLEMFMLVAGVWMRVSELVVVVFVGTRCVMTVSIGCHCRLRVVEIRTKSIALSTMPQCGMGFRLFPWRLGCRTVLMGLSGAVLPDMAVIGCA
jgi:hypothetical protein